MILGFSYLLKTIGQHPQKKNHHWENFSDGSSDGSDGRPFSEMKVLCSSRAQIHDGSICLGKILLMHIHKEIRDAGYYLLDVDV